VSDFGDTLIRCGLQFLHEYSIPQRGVKVAYQIPFRQGKKAGEAAIKVIIDEDNFVSLPIWAFLYNFLTLIYKPLRNKGSW
jgi:hypothetical protein